MGLCFRKPVILDTPSPLQTHSNIIDATYDNSIIFIPPITIVKVIKVYDGDTITIATTLPIINDTNIYRFSVRLAGIDTAEIHSKNKLEREIAEKSREILHQLIFGKIVELKNIKFEKYGRLLADVYTIDTQIHVNDYMLKHGYANPYDGKTKSHIFNGIIITE